QVVFFTLANVVSAAASWMLMAALSAVLLLVLLLVGTRIADPVFTDSESQSEKA
ncbi:MAG TPA: MFS transporter, partial [Lactobacillus sp.]|nr:MFS transporter [Lactobacillus sp.]